MRRKVQRNAYIFKFCFAVIIKYLFTVYSVISMKGMLLLCCDKVQCRQMCLQMCVSVFCLSLYLCPLTVFVLITLNTKGTLLEAQNMSAE
jgi:hypothetical protein